MVAIETEVVSRVNHYLKMWRETGRIVKPLPSKEDTTGLPFSATLNQIIAALLLRRGSLTDCKNRKSKKETHRKTQ